MSGNIITKRRLWVLPETLEAMLTLYKTPYVGQLPAPIVQAMKPYPQDILKAFDFLAQRLSPIGSIGIDVTTSCTVGRNNVSLRLKTIGRGAYGAVYQLIINNHTYAFKIYHLSGNAEAEDIDGVWHEIRTALYFPRKPLKDIARFYCANPQSGWALFELITPNMSVESRQGLPINRFPVELLDGYNNSVSGIRVDYGCINIKQRKSTGLRNFMNAFKYSNTHLQARMATQIHELPENERKIAFEIASRSPHATVQRNVATQIAALPGVDRKAAFDWAMATKIPSVQANAALHIGSLPETDRQTVFEQTMTIQDPDIQANAVTQISSLSPGHRKAAFESAMKIQNPIVQACVVTQIWALSRSERKSAFESAMATEEPIVQASAANQIWSLPEDDRMAAFECAMATQKPDVQANAAVQTKFLSKPEQKSVLENYIQSISEQQNCLETLQSLKLTIGLEA